MWHLSRSLLHGFLTTPPSSTTARFELTARSAQTPAWPWTALGAARGAVVERFQTGGRRDASAAQIDRAQAPSRQIEVSGWPGTTDMAADLVTVAGSRPLCRFCLLRSPAWLAHGRHPGPWLLWRIACRADPWNTNSARFYQVVFTAAGNHLRRATHNLRSFENTDSWPSEVARTGQAGLRWYLVGGEMGP